MKNIVLIVAIVCTSFELYAQPNRWQQRVKYVMDIDMDVTTNRYSGKQKLEYTNNSPDTLDKLFYHVYWNAFQPNSMMDTRSRELGKTKIGRGLDWDARVRDRILNLKENEIGYQKIKSLKLNGAAQTITEHETILEVKLSKPILPKQKVMLEMEWDAQVPLQVRRSGRDAANGVKFSMSQWYPKLCEYDADGWHPNPYIAREFYGVWGDFDVNITIDKKFIIGGTGYLTNANQIGHGYEAAGVKVVRPAGDKLTWKFTAPNVHDFVWAADAEYKHIVRKVKNGATLHVFYNYQPNNPKNDEAWMKVADAAEIAYPFITKTFGAYPYKQYSFIQGGDGGMEYPMATLLNGPGLGTVFHEWMHTWYQMLMGTNESLYAWMDEGFTEYATDLVANYYFTEMAKRSGTTREDDDKLPKYHADNYSSYFNLVKSRLEEPMTTHADHFNTNFAYSIASYSKGALFLSQLGYIAGDTVRDKILLEYYKQWRFKHPNVNDFMRVAEKVSGQQLDWYKEYWVNSTKTIDYGIDSLWEEGGKSKIRLKRVNEMPMPIDLVLTFKDGTQQMHYVPAYLMFGEKPAENTIARTVYPAWKWTHPTYVIEFDKPLRDLTIVEIDPTQRMADVDRRNNKLELKW